VNDKWKWVCEDELECWGEIEVEEMEQKARVRIMSSNC
jgi:hypothetical protein